jgi:hypothetical protein
MSDRINPNIGDASASEFDPGISREEAEDWLNEVPLFEPPPEDE